MNIPDKAVEAAWDKLHENPIRPIGIDYAELEAAMEAAAPHMLDAGWAKAYAVGFEDAKGGKNYNAADTNPYRITK